MRVINFDSIVLAKLIHKLELEVVLELDLIVVLAAWAPGVRLLL